jgi:hypothetical protein
VITHSSIKFWATENCLGLIPTSYIFYHYSIFHKKYQRRFNGDTGTNIKSHTVSCPLVPLNGPLHASTHSQKDMRVIPSFLPSLLPSFLPSFSKIFHFHYYFLLYCPDSSHSILTIFCAPTRKSLQLVRRKRRR